MECSHGCKMDGKTTTSTDLQTNLSHLFAPVLAQQIHLHVWLCECAVCECAYVCECVYVCECAYVCKRNFSGCVPIECKPVDKIWPALITVKINEIVTF